MGKIRQLPESIVSRIAAGEVIERPVYAVKELLENALDAGATRISLAVEDAGLKKIVITDNGEGMSREDIELSWRPHTTSKLDDDLVGIRSLGFRGEALSSLSAISDLIIQSRLHTETAGFQLHIKTGILHQSGAIGIPPGTTITVTNLFSSVPARKKFLKSIRTELRHIIHVVSSYALSRPDVRFLLTHNKRILLDVSPQNKNERIQEVLGKHFFHQLLPIMQESDYLHISGFIAHPHLFSKKQTKQYLFVNNRNITNKMIISALKDAYGGLLEPTHYPVFVLFIRVPYEMIDVNIHPRKEDISFLNASQVAEEIRSSVQKILEKQGGSFYKARFEYGSRAGSTSSYAAHVMRETTQVWDVKKPLTIAPDSSIAVIHDTYILLQTAGGIVLVDYHAAHERILYEQFFITFNKKQKTQKTIALKKSCFVDLSLEEMEAFEHFSSELERIGFSGKRYSKTTIELLTVPELFQDRDFNQFLPELLEEYMNDGKSTLDTVSERMIKFLACRSAVKAGDKISHKESKRLIQQLEKTKNNATCPHGRPTKIEISKQEFDTLFKRR